MRKFELKKVGLVLAAVFLSLGSGFIGAMLYGAFFMEDGEVVTTVVVESEGEAVLRTVETISPSVVSIVVSGTTSVNMGWFFGTTEQETQGAGTGVIISEDGYVLTNRHVIPENTTDISVVLYNGTRHDNVEIVGRDPINDIAFLRIPNVSGLTPAGFSNEQDITIGTKVLAVGNALGV
jgi:serine protease Do